MAINRVPKIRTLDGKSIKVSKWISCNLDSEFASTVFEVDDEIAFESILEATEVILQTEEREYLVKLNRLSQGENVRVNGRIEKREIPTAISTK